MGSDEGHLSDLTCGVGPYWETLVDPASDDLRDGCVVDVGSLPQSFFFGGGYLDVKV